MIVSHRHSRRRSLALLSAAGLAGLGSSSADAGLLLDLRATGASGGAIVFDPKSYTVFSPGDVITLGLFARVTGTDGLNNETLTAVYGLVNSVGSLKGNLAGGPVVPFREPSFQNGSVIDWDSDGDLDIGLSPTNSGSTGKFHARGTLLGVPMQTSVSPNAGESLIGEFTWTYTGGGPFTDINFRIRHSNGNNLSLAALWFEDGSTIAKNPTSSFASVGTPVNWTDEPEPSAISALAFTAIGLLARRRGARR